MGKQALEKKGLYAWVYDRRLRSGTWLPYRATSSADKARRLEGKTHWPPKSSKTFTPLAYAEGKGLFLRSDFIKAQQELKHGRASKCGMAADGAERGDKGRALNRLERAFAQLDAGLICLQVDEEFNKARSDPRYQKLLQRMKF